MRIKILRNVGKKDVGSKGSDNPNSLELAHKKDGSLPREGEVCDFKDEDAEKYLKAGMAEITDEPVGLPPPPLLGPGPIPVTVVETPPVKPAAVPKVMAPGFEEAGKGASTVPADDYDAWTVEELHKEASDRQLEGRSQLTSHDLLVKALRKDDKAKKK